MFEGALSPFHWLVVLAIVLMIFGPRKLPELGKGLGSAIRGFKDALNGGDELTAKDGQAAKGDRAPPAKYRRRCCHRWLLHLGHLESAGSSRK